MSRSCFGTCYGSRCESPPHCGALRFWRSFYSLHTTSCVLSLLLREQVRNTLLVFSRMSGLRFRSRAAAGPRCKDLKRMPSNVNLGEFLSQYYKTELRQGKRRGHWKTFSRKTPTATATLVSVARPGEKCLFWAPRAGTQQHWEELSTFLQKPRRAFNLHRRKRSRRAREPDRSRMFHHPG